MTSMIARTSPSARWRMCSSSIRTSCRKRWIISRCCRGGGSNALLSPGWGILMCLFAACALFCNDMDYVAGDFAPAGATKGLSARPLETFGAHPCLLNFIGSFLVRVPFFPLSFPTSARRTSPHRPVRRVSLFSSLFPDPIILEPFPMVSHHRLVAPHESAFRQRRHTRNRIRRGFRHQRAAV